MTELTNQRTAALIQQAGKANAPKGTVAQKVGDYYASYMDEAAIEAKGLAPLRPALDRIDAIEDRPALARVLGSSLRADVDALNNTNLYTDNLFGLWIAQDLDEPTRYVPFLLQGGLDLPDRAYYLDPSPRMAGHPHPLPGAHREGARPRARSRRPGARPPASSTWSGASRRRIGAAQDSSDMKKDNNHWTRKEFDTAAPGLDWKEYFGRGGPGRASRCSRSGSRAR